MPETYSLPDFDIARLPGAIVLQEEMDTEGDFRAVIMMDLSKATIAQLKQGIAIHQNEVARAADGLHDLTSLLNRRLMQGAQDADPAWLDPEDDAFRAKVHEHINRDAKRFAEVMDGFDFDAHINAALRVANETYQHLKVIKEPGSAWAVIEIDRKSKPLIQALQRRGIGRLDGVRLTYVIECGAVVKGVTAIADITVQSETISAFALKLSEPGFELRIMSKEE